MRVYMTSLGCKLNQAEIETMSRELLARGHQVVDDPGEADWALINTCTVTRTAASKSRQLARSLHRHHPALRLALTGCYAEMAPEQLARLAGVDLVISNRAKEEAVDRLLAQAGAEVEGGHAAPAVERLATGHTRAFVKVQDGCDNRCTYCLVTVARGEARSLAPERVLAEVSRRASEGYREIVLTGINIGAYGRDRGADAPLPRDAGWSLARLARQILDETSVARLRLSSIEPPDLDAALLDVFADPRLCRHVHLPLQSGSDAILRSMARQYTTRQYAETVARLRETLPDVSLTTDLIVGFPGETDEAFETGYRFVEQMAFARLHVFKYSRRAGTVAADLPDQVPPDVARERSRRLIALGHAMGLAYHRRLVGKQVPVLIETDRRVDGRRIWDGLTDTYVRVTLEDERHLANRFVLVRCEAADEQGVSGQVVQVAP